MWEQGWRDRIWSELEKPWDVIVIGGGITGAGILREAVRAGLRTLLLEAHDFASGTSSRSGKLVHGGLRYLRSGQLRLTWQSVRERERLLREGRGLISPLPQLMACFRHDPIPPWVFGAGLVLYDVLALKWGHRRYDAAGLIDLCPPLAGADLVGGFRYFDAQTDDARLVLRLLREATRQEWGRALNYARVECLLRRRSGEVVGVAVRDLAPGSDNREAEVQAGVVISATGAWADDLRLQLGCSPRLRQLRGSHLFLPASRLPLTRAVLFLHPIDHRPLYVFPWEGVIIAGTTDVDHGRPAEIDPAIQPGEFDYLLTALRHAFPTLELGPEDVLSTQAGIRAVVHTGKTDPSKESREHVLWQEAGLLTVSGGKLTTFRRMACDALRVVRSRLPRHARLDEHARVLDAPPVESALRAPLDPSTRLRLLGRYGADAPALVAAAVPEELQPIPGSPSLWAELRWAARAEGIVHLDDLLLRRLRLGLTCPQGALPFLDRIRTIVQAETGWDGERWQQEAERYASLWKACYGPPGQGTDPKGGSL